MTNPQTPPATSARRPHFISLPDLALRDLGGAVIWSNDDFFAEAQNLIRTPAAEYQPATFGHRGQIYDGWETRRRREAGEDSAIIRLGVPGEISGVVVDTAWFTGNYPPEISVAAATVDGLPTVDEVRAAEWTEIVPRSPVNGDTKNPFRVDSDRRFTHVKLTMHPDGGIARLRVHGHGIPNPQLLDSGPLDLAALENGGLITGCSNMFYSSPNNLLMPGRARTMGEGWETSRRRDSGNDWVQVQLAGAGTLRSVEIDTSYFLGNAPGKAQVRGKLCDGDWVDLLPLTTLQPDTRHRLPLAATDAVDTVRLDVYPDGGLARLRLYGDLTAQARAELSERWQQ